MKFPKALLCLINLLQEENERTSMTMESKGAHELLEYHVGLLRTTPTPTVPLRQIHRLTMMITRFMILEYFLSTLQHSISTHPMM